MDCQLSDPARAGPDERSSIQRPVAAIFRSPVFNQSETFVRAHAAALRRYSPFVVGLERKGEFPATRDDAAPLIASRTEGLALKLFGQPAALERRVRARIGRPAIMHAHFATDGLLALPLARSLGLPLVTTFHGFDVSRFRRKLMLSGRLSWMRYALLRQRLIDGGDLFLAVSEALRAKAIVQGYPAEKVVTHYNGINLARFARSQTPPEPGLVLHVARLVEKKGTGLLIRALAMIKTHEPDARVVIIGDGPMRQELERLAARLGVASAVRFLGNISYDEVGAWMARAWLLAVPSVTASDGDSEGLPTTIVEAAASMLPVIGSDHSGIPEAIVEGQTGFIVKEGEVDPLAARIVQLLRSGDMRRHMATASRLLAESRFDEERQIGRLEGYYDQLAAGGWAWKGGPAQTQRARGRQPTGGPSSYRTFTNFLWPNDASREFPNDA